MNTARAVTGWPGTASSMTNRSAWLRGAMFDLPLFLLPVRLSTTTLSSSGSRSMYHSIRGMFRIAAAPWIPPSQFV
jgi:hypothetical protein